MILGDERGKMLLLERALNVLLLYWSDNGRYSSDLVSDMTVPLSRHYNDICIITTTNSSESGECEKQEVMRRRWRAVKYTSDTGAT